MTRSKYIFLFVVFSFLITTCKKEEEDYIKKETIRGNVRNNCTGKGFANVEVKLLERHENGNNNVDVNSYSCITDTNGNFIFKDIDIHYSDKYSYAEYIESHYSPDYNFYGIGPIEIEKGSMSVFNQIGISASFKVCKIMLPLGITVSTPDTFAIKFEQLKLHYYEPDRNWVLNRYSSAGNTTGEILSLATYPMGWWHITFDKTKDGIHSIINDSIYLEMGADTSYTIPW